MDVKELKKERKRLRDEIYVNKILNKPTQLLIKGSFDGYGDSGTISINTTDDELRRFLESYVEHYVTFDWYNNEGGGGDITWDVVADKITINGYYNEIRAVQAMEGVEV